MLVKDAGGRAVPTVLFRGARIFDGKSEGLTGDRNLLVSGGRIEKISRNAIDAPDGALVIDGRGLLLTPGFIDAHYHCMFYKSIPETISATPWVAGIWAKESLEAALMRGFTTIRDAGGADGSIARAVDNGDIMGPRLFASGMSISQTCGHGDFTPPYASHPYFGGCRCDGLRTARGLSVIADGSAEVLRAARENLKNGATQLKLMGGGGVMSDYDPLHVVEYTPGEVRAAVSAAENWGTYVMTHAYNAASVRMLIENGVRSVEHGHLLDEDTIRMAAEKGVVICTQLVCFWAVHKFGEEMGVPEESVRKAREILESMDNALRLFKKYHIKMGFGTDLLGPIQKYQNKEFTLRSKYFTPAEILRQATSESAEIIRMCGPLNPYGMFGEVREGYLADLLLIDGDPLRDISLLEDPERCLLVIMKDGRIHKNALSR
jgi:imidazolonepropionase-like amidohydrolase